ncbi:DUF4190 domain-containing protein [Pseudoclavibacter chungangensis]|uniref:DUF4190 domain-containing protein n=1 Tax=Pseudoclavibacter chungangensis TaxID=587635 RepID=A0A7J5BU40_9MICO|nr:DUF4190 domain-containing protein [Pseudoclavibacter chungangensis]KAB1657855.1 DUF4190 domain-containing protein [Pseudoclavibacter chungangensis]NYJ66544.1 hypothetical protein [Pseudoclavibacter chungangensis]
MDTNTPAPAPPRPTTDERPADEVPGDGRALVPAPPVPAPAPVDDPTARGLAIAALVTAAAGFGPVAIVLGHIALVRLPAATDGRGLAIAGLVLGYITTVGFVIGMLVVAIMTILPILVIAIIAIGSAAGAG